jgi:hypothetical protein
MYTRRNVLGTVGAAGLAGLAGCSLLGGGGVEESADQAAVSDDALTSTGFEHNGTEEKVLEQTVDVGDESRDITLTNYLAKYGKQLEGVGQDAATFRIFTTPGVTVAGQKVNPLRALDDEKLLKAIIDRAGASGIENLEQVGTQPVSVLGSSVTFKQYEGTTTIEDQEIEILLHFGRTTNEGQMVSMLGVHPKAEPLNESENIYALAEGVVHPAESEE